MQRHVEDHSFNKLVQSGSPMQMLIAVGMKYGFAPVACLVMVYYIHTKDAQLQSNQDQIVSLVQKTTEALTASANSQKELVRAIHHDIEERAR